MAKYSSDVKKGEKEVSKELIDRLVKRRTFEPFNRPRPRNDIFIFSKRGDEVSGWLGPPIANVMRNTSYMIKQDNGEVIEIFGNKLLHRIIRKNELVHQKVRIVYIGLQHTGRGRPRKIYRVYKIKWDETQEQVGG